jgi:S-adenosylmethionine synthetase
LEMHYLLSNKSSPGKVDEKASSEWTRKFWFEPRSLNDLKELKFLWSNDTSLWCWYYPYSKLEYLILEIENTLNSNEYKKDKPRLWNDIKLMWTRFKNEIDITLCVPQICTYVKNIDEYKNNIEIVKSTINDIFKRNNDNLNIEKFTFHINTRDDYETCELYLTATGSSIESWDEWLVWRWNRINWVISPMKPMSMEWAAWKNPVYHIGKVYYIAAQLLAEKVSNFTWTYSEVYLVSQSGRSLIDPWKTVVYTDESYLQNQELITIIENELKNIPQITENFLWGKAYY